MTTSAALRRYWRIPVVGLLAAALAFVASFVVSPTYESSTRLLVHGRDATFLTSTGQDLTGQPGVIDSSLSQALISTYAGIATSRTVATSVVDQLKLDQRPAKTGVYAVIAQGVAWVYRCGRAFVTAGFCAPLDRHEQAILDVQQGTNAQATGTNAGNSAGSSPSYVLEVSGSGQTAVESREVTDALADELVLLSNDRFKRDAAKNVAGLQAQVDAAAKDAKAKTLAVASYQTKHGISTADVKQTLSAATLEDVRASLMKARADLADTQAQLASVEGSLAQVPKDQRSKQTIVTGRSTTESSTDSSNTVYSDLVTHLNELKASEAGFTARVARLQRQIDRAKPLSKNGPLAELAIRQRIADLATANVVSLTSTLQKAQTTAAQGSVDLSRLDSASQPSYPSKPKRYIYLALGLLIGALAGAVLTAQAQRRRDEVVEDEAPVAERQFLDDDTHQIPLIKEEDDPLDLVYAGGGSGAERNGHSNGQTTGHTNGHSNGHRPPG